MTGPAAVELNALPYDTVRPVAWAEDALRLLDQRLLPGAEEFLTLRDAAGVAAAIRGMAVRGAPAIGIAAAYGVVLAARDAWGRHGEDWRMHMAEPLRLLESARPTAVNLHWAVARLRSGFDDIDGDPGPVLLGAADRLLQQDIAGNRRMGELGAPFVHGAVITHCNAGSLATGGYGTALGVVRSAWAADRITRIHACETRPALQGARLTAWELMRDGIPVTLMADSAAGALMRAGRVDCVIVGADRIAANGDTANKIGTYVLAVLARRHGVKFVVAAPTATIDPATPDGDAIPIEERDADEIAVSGERRNAPPGVPVLNPVFDVTPAELIDVLVTEKGVIEGPDGARIRALLED